MAKSSFCVISRKYNRTFASTELDAVVHAGSLLAKQNNQHVDEFLVVEIKKVVTRRAPIISYDSRKPKSGEFVA